jgi:archaellum component FlaC
MGVLDNVKDFAKNVGDKAGGAVETTKLNSKINSEQNAINAVMKQIGEFYYNKYLESGTADEGIKEFCAVIDGHNATIAGAKAEIERIKTKNTAAVTAPDPAASAPAPAAAGVAICPACGAEVAPGMKFCGVCGAKIE